jgi:gliding motility-associated-like protein
MQKCIAALIFVLGMAEASAQEFIPQFGYALPDSVNFTELIWADFDNDSLLDVIVSGKTADNKTIFSIYRNELTAFTHEVSFSGFINSASLIVDVDSDNQMDLVISGDDDGHARTSVFYNQGNFVFEKQLILEASGSVLKFEDVNQDGTRELLLSGIDADGPFFRIYRGAPDQLHIVNDSIKIAATSIEIFDFNSDCKNDIFISGVNAEGAQKSAVWYNQGGFFFRDTQLLFPLAGFSSVSDLNHDGRLDIALTGKGLDAENRSVLFFNDGNSFRVESLASTLSNSRIFTGDLTSDGKCDISISGGAPGLGQVQVIVNAGDADTLATPNSIRQAFGDFDRDGDLDVAELTIIPGEELRFSKNVVQGQNLTPSPASEVIAAKIFDRIFMYWAKSEDDHTPQASITFDVVIQSPGSEVLSGTFDQLNEKRLLVAHGNQGTSNSLLLKAKDINTFSYMIQGVDNAYHAGWPHESGTGLCIGTSQSCEEKVTYKALEACRNEQVTLSASAEVRWFSFRKGYLGVYSTLAVNVISPDTLFSLNVAGAGGCAEIEVYTIGITTIRNVKTVSTKYVCEGQELVFQAEPGWEQILWSSAKKGDLSDESSIVFTATESDTVKLLLSDGEGCNIQRHTALNISKPVLVLENDAYQIMKGESVQLNASGGDTYEWNPATGLDNNQVNNPVARPAETTEYTVTITDSTGCEANGKVLVIVEETAFIPNLFTPNEDGRNDELKAYGLDNVSHFSFLIYNREGSLVYSTENVNDLASSGWNGTVRGVKQPTGVYYWKVKGESATGKDIRLNGKSSGSIVLIR